MTGGGLLGWRPCLGTHSGGRVMVAESGRVHEGPDYSLPRLSGALTLCQVRCQGYGAGKTRGTPSRRRRRGVDGRFLPNAEGK